MWPTPYFLQIKPTDSVSLRDIKVLVGQGTRSETLQESVWRVLSPPLHQTSVKRQGLVTIHTHGKQVSVCPLSELFPLQKSLLECASEPSLALTVPCATRSIMVLYALCCSLVPYAVAWCPMLVFHALCWYFTCIISFYQWACEKAKVSLRLMYSKSHRRHLGSVMV